MAANAGSDSLAGSVGSATERDGATGADLLIEGPRPMRADAVKNRRRILEAAEEVFAREGVGVPIDAVAERAGVGVGTLYRHFPNKEALFEAIVIDRITQLLEAAGRLRDSSDPGEALYSFLREIAQHASAKRDLFDALTSAGIDIKSRCSEMVDEMMRNLDMLVEHAIAARAVRDDLPTSEIIGLVIGTCHAGADSGIDEAGVQRMVGVVIDGLRPPVLPRSEEGLPLST